ncbi:hypothetical protein ACK3TF_003056 [Chlorella vulgaris]
MQPDGIEMVTANQADTVPFGSAVRVQVVAQGMCLAPVPQLCALESFLEALELGSENRAEQPVAAGCDSERRLFRWHRATTSSQAAWAQQLVAALPATGVHLDLHQIQPNRKEAVLSACSMRQQLLDAAYLTAVCARRRRAVLAQLRTFSHWGAEGTGRRGQGSTRTAAVQPLQQWRQISLVCLLSLCRRI